MIQRSSDNMLCECNGTKYTFSKEATMNHLGMFEGFIEG